MFYHLLFLILHKILEFITRSQLEAQSHKSWSSTNRQTDKKFIDTLLAGDTGQYINLTVKIDSYIVSAQKKRYHFPTEIAWVAA